MNGKVLKMEVKLIALPLLTNNFRCFVLAKLFLYSKSSQVILFYFAAIALEFLAKLKQHLYMVIIIIDS